MWEYDFQARKSQCVSYAITFDQEEQVRHWERRDCELVPVNVECNRCNGFRVLEMVQDGGLRAKVYRCILCGDLVDQRILSNRRSHNRSRPSRSRTSVHGSER